MYGDIPEQEYSRGARNGGARRRSAGRSVRQTGRGEAGAGGRRGKVDARDTGKAGDWGEAEGRGEARRRAEGQNRGKTKTLEQFSAVFLSI